MHNVDQKYIELGSWSVTEVTLDKTKNPLIVLNCLVETKILVTCGTHGKP